MFWIGVGTQVAKAQGFLKLASKPYTTEGCRVINASSTALGDFSEWVSTTTTLAPIAQAYVWVGQCILLGRMFHWFFSFLHCFIRNTAVEEPLAIYQLSYMWYSAVGCLTVVIVGMIVSTITGLQDPKKLNPGLICNVGKTIYWFLPKKMREVDTFYYLLIFENPKNDF